MPRVKYVHKPEDGNALIRMIDVQRFLHGKRDADVCEEMDTGTNWMSNRRRHPMTFRLDELLKLSKFLKFEVRIYDGKLEVKAL